MSDTPRPPACNNDFCALQKHLLDYAAASVTCFSSAEHHDDVGGLQMLPRLYFGRQVAVSDRSVIARYALPKRAYLGPTSMDTEMAFIICNQAHVSAFSHDCLKLSARALLLQQAARSRHLSTSVQAVLYRHAKESKAG